MPWLEASIELQTELHFHPSIPYKNMRWKTWINQSRYAPLSSKCKSLAFEQGWYRVLTSSLYWDGVFLFAQNYKGNKSGLVTISYEKLAVTSHKPLKTACVPFVTNEERLL